MQELDHFLRLVELLVLEQTVPFRVAREFVQVEVHVLDRAELGKQIVDVVFLDFLVEVPYANYEPFH